jgi:S-DNA-T family DNA segregation ATPase FtsK/SpoIIIE
MRRTVCSLIVLASTPVFAQQTLSPIQQFMQNEAGYPPQAYVPPAPQPVQPAPSYPQQQAYAPPPAYAAPTYPPQPIYPVQQYLQSESGYAPPQPQPAYPPQPTYPAQQAYVPPQQVYRAPQAYVPPAPLPNTGDGGQINSGVRGMNF